MTPTSEQQNLHPAALDLGASEVERAGHLKAVRQDFLGAALWLWSGSAGLVFRAS